MNPDSVEYVLLDALNKAVLIRRGIISLSKERSCFKNNLISSCLLGIAPMFQQFPCLIKILNQGNQQPIKHYV